MREWVHCCDEAANHQLPIASAFWIIRISSAEECSSLTQKLMQVHCSSQSFWMWRPTAHMLTQRCLPPPLTSRVKSSLIMHAHSSPLSLVARFQHCCINHFHYINNGWIFPDRPHICTYIFKGKLIGIFTQVQPFVGRQVDLCTHVFTHTHAFLCCMHPRVCNMHLHIL